MLESVDPSAYQCCHWWIRLKLKYLGHWFCMDWAAHNYLNWRLLPNVGTSSRIKQWNLLILAVKSAYLFPNVAVATMFCFLEKKSMMILLSIPVTDFPVVISWHRLILFSVVARIPGSDFRGAETGKMSGTDKVLPYHHQKLLGVSFVAPIFRTLLRPRLPARIGLVRHRHRQRTRKIVT